MILRTIIFIHIKPVLELLALKTSLDLTSGIGGASRSDVDRANGLDTSDFKTIRKSDYFVDKTLLVEAFMNSKEPYQYVTAPPKFGKSTNLDMLMSFLSIQVDDNGAEIKTGTEDIRNVFKGTQIFNKKSFVEKHFQKYVILTVDFSYFRVITRTDYFPFCICRVFCRMKIKCTNLYKLNTIFPEDSYLTEDERTCNTRCQENWNPAEGRTLAEKLSKHFKKQVIVLGDEYDSIWDMLWTSKMNDKMTISNYLDTFVHELVKGNEFVSRAIFVASSTLGGVVSAFGNNIEHISFDSPKNYWQFFGFMTDDVKFLLDKHELTHKMQDVTGYYDGYTVPEHPDVVLFNPYSIVKYVAHKKPGYYWGEKVPPLNYLAPLFANPQIGRDVELIIFGKSDVFIFEHKGATLRTVDKLLGGVHDRTKRSVLTEKQITMVIQHLTERGYLTTDRDMPVSNSGARYLKPANKETRKALEEDFLRGDFYVKLLRYTRRQMDMFAEDLYNLSENQTTLELLAAAIHHVFEDGCINVHNGKVGMLGPLYTEIKYHSPLRESFPVVEAGVRVYYPNGSFSLLDLLVLTDKGDATVIKFERKCSEIATKPVVASDYFWFLQQTHFKEKVKHKRFMRICLNEECTCEITSLRDTFDLEKNVTVQFPLHKDRKKDEETKRTPKIKRQRKFFRENRSAQFV